MPALFCYVNLSVWGNKWLKRQVIMYIFILASGWIGLKIKENKSKSQVYREIAAQWETVAAYISDPTVFLHKPFLLRESEA